MHTCTIATLAQQEYDFTLHSIAFQALLVVAHYALNVSSTVSQSLSLCCIHTLYRCTICVS
jgi:hypothetical protein